MAPFNSDSYRAYLKPIWPIEFVYVKIGNYTFRDEDREGKMFKKKRRGQKLNL